MIQMVCFSFVPYKVFHNEDIRAYIHCNIKEFGNLDMSSLYAKHMVDDFENLKSDFKNLESKGFIQFVHFSVFDKPEWVRYVLSQIHDEFLWLDKSHKITKKAIEAVTYLNATSKVPGLWNEKNTTVMEVTGSKHDSQSMTISDIVEFDVKFSSMATGYKVYQLSRQNSVSGTAIYATY